jgi:hypothetical protein
MTQPDIHSDADVLNTLMHTSIDDLAAQPLIRQLARSGYFEAKAEIARFLDSHEPWLQEDAINCLFYTWGDGREYEDKVTRMAFDDPTTDEDVRRSAIGAISALHENTKDDRILNRLIAVLRNESNDEFLRSAAYGAILYVLGVPARLHPSAAKDMDFERDVDWELIRGLRGRDAID